MQRSLHALFIMSALSVGCGSDSSEPESHDHPAPVTEDDVNDDDTDKDQSEADVEWQALVDELQSEKDQLQERIGTLEDALKSASDKVKEAEGAITKGDADAKAQATIATAEQKRLSDQLAAVKEALDAANKKLEDRSYDDAIAELKAARILLEKLETARAQAPGALNLNVALRYGAQAFALDHAYELTGGKLSFSTLRYWLSNVVLVRNDDTRVVIPNTYYLMGAAAEQTLESGTQKTLTLPAQRRELVALSNVPPGSYKAVEFQIGVDAEHNDDLSLLAGELNVLRNMTGVEWMWFTSYIFTKTQASFTPTATPTTPAAVHWEGGTNADLRTVNVSLGSVATVELGDKPQINLSVDVADVIAGINPATTASIGASDAANRTILADNWAEAFSFESITTQP